MKKLANNKIRALRAKLSALAAAPGTEDEGKAATAKLARLDARYDFSQADVSKDDIFAGKWIVTRVGVRVTAIPDMAVSPYVKWAIEEQTGVPCSFQGADLYAETSPACARRLETAANGVSCALAGLWQAFSSKSAQSSGDRSLFLRGLFDGMMNDGRQNGQPLPTRIVPKAKGRKSAPAVGVHPYSVALDLGRGIRFAVPLDGLVAQLESKLKGEIAC